MPRSDRPSDAFTLLRPRLPRMLSAVALGVLSLGSALALAGVSAWLITRAWQMPPVVDLSIAVVAVRTFAISRGVLHYCERLATHDTALRAAGTARAQIYHRLARGSAATALRLHSGELVARVGADVDECRARPKQVEHQLTREIPGIPTLQHHAGQRIVWGVLAQREGHSASVRKRRGSEYR